VAGGLDVDVMLDRQLSIERLARYHLILVAEVPVIDDDAASILAAAAAGGATVLATRGSGRLTTSFAPVATDLFTRVPGITVAPPVEASLRLARTLAELADPPWQVSTSSPVIHVARRGDGRLLLHLLNLEEVPAASIELAGFPGSPTVHSPDASAPVVAPSEGGLTVTGLDLYAVLAFDTGVPA
jgi:hypothetical protein